jgi:hypothetical protein
MSLTLFQHLGAQFDDYWRQLKDFFVFKYVSVCMYTDRQCFDVFTVRRRLSKKDLDAMVNNLCGPKVMRAPFSHKDMSSELVI